MPSRTLLVLACFRIDTEYNNNKYFLSCLYGASTFVIIVIIASMLVKYKDKIHNAKKYDLEWRISLYDYHIIIFQ